MTQNAAIRSTAQNAAMLPMACRISYLRIAFRRDRLGGEASARAHRALRPRHSLRLPLRFSSDFVKTCVMPRDREPGQRLAVSR